MLAFILVSTLEIVAFHNDNEEKVEQVETIEESDVWAGYNRKKDAGKIRSAIKGLEIK